MPITNVLIAGVGGQGAVLASELLALAAIEDGRDVKQGEFHGVAQRGGAVFSHVRFGDRVFSPMARRGQVDFLLALEKLEALRYVHFLKPCGTAIVNDHEIEPVRLGDDRPYPTDAIEFLKLRGLTVIALDGTERAMNLGNHHAANVVLLGVLSRLLDIPTDVWERTLTGRIPDRLLELNRRAFSEGMGIGC